MAKQFNRSLGKLGEDKASEYLIKKGFKIVERNYSTKFGEIDLIVTHSTGSGQAILSFVEVKLKHGDDFGTPEEMIGESKLARVQHMAEFYLLENPDKAKIYEAYSIDAVCMVTNENGEVERINHYENLTF